MTADEVTVGEVIRKLDGILHRLDEPEVVPAAAAEPSAATQDARSALATRVNKINLIWEYTQSLLAASIVLAVLYLAITGKTIPDALGNILFLVIGFYFGRTNHARPGGGTQTGGGP